MELSARQQGILVELQSGDYVEVKALARRLGVDGSTIRRDLKAIGEVHGIERFHGGVRIRQASDVDPRSALANEAIAKGARRLLGNDQSIALGGGPIAEQLVPLLGDLSGLRVVTTSLRIADRLDTSGIAVHLVGGDLVPGTGELVGEDSVRRFDRIDVDWSLVEVDGVHHFAGFTVSSPWRVATLRALLGAGERRCVLAASGAFGKREVGFVSAVDSSDLLITDELLGDDALPAYEGRVVRTPLDYASSSQAGRH